MKNQFTLPYSGRNMGVGGESVVMEAWIIHGKAKKGLWVVCPSGTKTLLVALWSPDLKSVFMLSTSGCLPTVIRPQYLVTTWFWLLGGYLVPPDKWHSASAFYLFVCIFWICYSLNQLPVLAPIPDLSCSLLFCTPISPAPPDSLFPLYIVR